MARETLRMSVFWSDTFANEFLKLIVYLHINIEHFKICCKFFLVSVWGEGKQIQARWPGKNFAKSVFWSVTFFEFVELIVHLKIYIEHFKICCKLYLFLDSGERKRRGVKSEGDFCTRHIWNYEILDKMTFCCWNIR